MKKSTYILFLGDGKPGTLAAAVGVPPPGLATISRRFESGLPASGIFQSFPPCDYDGSTACIQTNFIELLDTLRPFRH